MSLFHRKPPWYAAGLAFECARCGNCCAGPHAGYVWLGAADITAIAAHLGIAEPEACQKYVRRAERRYSLIERKDNRDCIFLLPDGEGRRKCAVYPVRPIQCRTWPFWKNNLSDPDSWARAGLRCPGINHGAVVSCNEIETRANATAE